MITINSTVPDIEVEAFHNEKTIKTKLSDYRGKWVALVFYPADFTFVCPTELQELAGLYSEFQKINTEVLSVSCDTVFVHKAWHDNSEAIKQIQFPMLADPARKMAEAFGVLIPNEGLALRGSFVIDPDGVLKTSEIHDNSIGRSASELLRKIQAAQFVREHGGKEVCPANWKPGAKTLKPGLDLVGKI
ncbi:MAG: redoxin domain-containing protein [Candidatus Kerfeldbacteria bacterium]|nr:redoxin domain-containing protein [Candidatus Kerfeldbacteria bacterium]